MVVCIRHLNEKDSTAVIQFSSADVGSSGKPFKLQILKSFGYTSTDSGLFYWNPEVRKRFRTSLLCFTGRGGKNPAP